MVRRPPDRDPDVLVDGDELIVASARDRLNTVLGVPEHALNVLFDFSEETPPLRKYHADGKHALTVVATIFLPLTVITGFFGMNFGWFTGEIGSRGDVWIFGVGSLVAAIVVALIVMRRELPVLVRKE
jgi:magnesium transporter